MKLNRFLFFFLFVTLFTSCDLLLGPLSTISLNQRLASGWKKTELFTDNLPSAITDYKNVQSKLRIFKTQGKIFGAFGISASNNMMSGYYTLTAFNNDKMVIHVTNFNYGSSPNIPSNMFDYFADADNYTIIFPVTSIMNVLKNGSIQFGLSMGTMNTGNSIILSGLDSVIGYSSMGLSSAPIANMSLPTNLTSPIMYPGNIYRSRNIYKDNYIIAYTTNSSGMDPKNSYIQFINSASFSPLLPNSYLNSIGGSQLIEILANSDNDLYYISGEGGGAAIFALTNNALFEVSWTEMSIDTRVNNFGSCAMDKNIFITSANSYMEGGNITVSVYDPDKRDTKTQTIYQIDKGKHPVGLDIYYDKDTLKMYIGYIETDGSILSYNLFENQF